MIYFISGVPGSGKTYWAVYEIVHKYFSFDSGVYVPKPGFDIFSNIDGIRLPFVQKFDVSLLNVNNPIYSDVSTKKIILIDECQRYLNRKDITSEAKYFLQYHRHLNVDIYLISQSIKLVDYSVQCLVEYDLRASRPSLRFFDSLFTYHIYVADEPTEKIRIKLDKKICALYQSAKVISKVQRNRYVQYLSFGIFLLIIAIGSGYYYFRKNLFSSLHTKDTVAVQPSKRPNIKYGFSNVFRSHSSVAVPVSVPSVEASVPSSKQICASMTTEGLELIVFCDGSALRNGQYIENYTFPFSDSATGALENAHQQKHLRVNNLNRKKILSGGFR